MRWGRGFQGQDFARLSPSWWQKSGNFAALHKLNPLRLSFIEQLTSLAGKEVLDYGCGGGLLAESLALRGASVTGVDSELENIKVARDHAKVNGIEIDYRQGISSDLRREEANFDLVCCLEVIEHVVDQEALVADLVSSCKPGGLLVFSTLSKTLPSLFGAKLLGEYCLRLLPPGTHDPRLFLRPSDLDKMLSKHGAQALQIAGVGYNPVNDKYYFRNSVSINYLLAARRATNEI